MGALPQPQPHIREHSLSPSATYGSIPSAPAPHMGALPQPQPHIREHSLSPSPTYRSTPSAPAPHMGALPQPQPHIREHSLSPSPTYKSTPSVPAPHTGALHPRILQMVAVVGSKAIVCTLLHKILAALTEHIVQPDGSGTGTKVGRREHCSGSGEAQRPTSHARLHEGPVVITDGTPGTIVVHLQAAISDGGGGATLGAVGQTQRVGIDGDIWSQEKVIVNDGKLQ